VEDTGSSTVLNVVATEADATAVVDADVLGRTLATLETGTLLVVEVETPEELVAEGIAVEDDEDVTLAVLDATLLPTTPPRTVESSGCVVAEVEVLVLVCTVLNIVVVATDTRAVVDGNVLGRAFATVEAKTLVIVDVTAAGEMVDELKLEGDDAVALAVLDTALLPTTPLRIVESSGCVVVVMLLLAVLALCGAVLRLAMARSVDCVVTTADEAEATETRVEAEAKAEVELGAEVEVDSKAETEVAVELVPTARPPPAFKPRLCVSVSTVEALALETGMVAKVAASEVVDTIESGEDDDEAVELELPLALEADTKMVVTTPPRLADVVVDASVDTIPGSTAAVVDVLAASTALRPLSTLVSAEVLREIVVETELADELDVCDAKIGRTIVTAPAASEVMAETIVVLDTGIVVDTPVATSDTDADVDTSEAPGSRIVPTTPPIVLVA